jgi:hypothetical protein
MQQLIMMFTTWIAIECANIWHNTRSLRAGERVSVDIQKDCATCHTIGRVMNQSLRHETCKQCGGSGYQKDRFHNVLVCNTKPIGTIHDVGQGWEISTMKRGVLYMSNEGVDWAAARSKSVPKYTFTPFLVVSQRHGS